jgi:hypothetical protein
MLLLFLYHKDMNEELAMQHSVQNQYQPAPKKRGVLKWVSLILLTLLLVGGIGYGVAYAWRQYADAKTSLASEQAKNKDLLTQNTLLQKNAADTAAPLAATETLPDGKTISYPLTGDNAQIVFWNQDGKVAISDKRVLSYVSSADAAVRKTLCGSTDNHFNQMEVSMGILDTTKKEVITDQDTFCLEQLSSSKNPNKTDQAAAQVVLDKVYDNLTQFIQSATIQ